VQVKLLSFRSAPVRDANRVWNANNPIHARDQIIPAP